MAEKWPVRYNLRLTEETADTYREFAELTGAEVTSVLRMFVEASVPAVDSMSAAIRQARLGNVELAAEIVQSFAGKMLAEGQYYNSQAQGLVEEVKAEVGKSA